MAPANTGVKNPPFPIFFNGTSKFLQSGSKSYLKTLLPKSRRGVQGSPSYMAKYTRRLTYHLQSGTPKNHTLQVHGTPLTREMLVDNTIILDTSDDKKRLQIKESLYINAKKPSMNIQVGTTSFPLPSQNRQQ